MNPTIKNMASGDIVISIGFGPLHYKSGLDRLLQSLQTVGWHGNKYIKWEDNYPDHETLPYCFKPRIMASLEEKKEYENLLWVDSSMYFIKPPNPIFEQIAKNGYYFVHNGFNCAQTCNDNCLNIFNISRNEAEKIPELASGVVGININTEIGKKVLDNWVHYTSLGACKGERQHNPLESSDSRFLFHRQDQSVLSLVAYKLGLKLQFMGDLWDFYTNAHIHGSKKINHSVVLLCRGM